MFGPEKQKVDAGAARVYFPGLDSGDRWCLCTGRWIEALKADIAPPVVLAATNEAVLDRVDMETLRAHAADR